MKGKPWIWIVVGFLLYVIIWFAFIFLSVKFQPQNIQP